MTIPEVLILLYTSVVAISALPHQWDSKVNHHVYYYSDQAKLQAEKLCPASGAFSVCQSAQLVRGKEIDYVHICPSDGMVHVIAHSSVLSMYCTLIVYHIQALVKTEVCATSQLYLLVQPVNKTTWESVTQHPVSLLMEKL